MVQDLAGEDMLSAAAYQPRMEVTDVEMMGGLTDKASLIDDPRAKKVSIGGVVCANFHLSYYSPLCCT